MLRDLSPPYGSRDQPYDIIMTAPGNERLDDQNDRPDTGNVDILDDIFGSAPSSPTVASATNNAATGDVPDYSLDQREQHPSDVPRLRSTHVTNGYREGIAASKEKYLQEGFDEGYSLGAELGLKAGWCLGVLEGVVNALPCATAGDDAVAKVSDRKNAAEMLERATQDLKLEVLCRREWFGEDGVWTYDVPGQDTAEEEGISFAEVAAAHPVVKNWVAKVREVTEGLGFTMPASLA